MNSMVCERIRVETYEKMYFMLFRANCQAMTLIRQEQYRNAYQILKRTGQETEEMYMSLPDDAIEAARKKRYLYPWDPEYPWESEDQEE